MSMEQLQAVHSDDIRDESCLWSPGICSRLLILTQFYYETATFNLKWYFKFSQSCSSSTWRRVQTKGVNSIFCQTLSPVNNAHMQLICSSDLCSLATFQRFGVLDEDVSVSRAVSTQCIIERCFISEPLYYISLTACAHTYTGLQ